MSNLNLPRDLLAKIAQGNPRVIAALEKVLQEVGDTLPSTIEEAQALAAQAQAAATLALAMLTDIAGALAQLAAAPALAPATEVDNHAPALAPPVDTDNHAPAPGPTADADDYMPRPYLGTMAAQNNDSVAITGGTVGVDAGDVLTPSLWFGQDPNTGLYRSAVSKIAVSIAQVKLLELSDRLAALTGRMQVDTAAIGTVALPALYFGADNTTGLYRAGADAIGLAIAGALLAKFSGTSVDVTGSVTATQQLKSTVAVGTAPLVVTSTTKVVNLYVDRAATADNLGTASTYPAAATDLPTVIALANALRTANTAKGV